MAKLLAVRADFDADAFAMAPAAPVQDGSQVALLPGPGQTVTPLVNNGEYRYEFDSASTRWFSVTLAAGQSIYLEGVDVPYAFYDATGASVAHQTFSRPMWSVAPIGFTAATAGTYYFALSGEAFQDFFIQSRTALTVMPAPSNH